MTKIKSISVWWYSHHSSDTEVNFHRHGGKHGSYSRVTSSSRKRLGDALFNFQPSVGIGAEYTSMYYVIKVQS